MARTQKEKNMVTKTFLAAKAANAIHEEGRRYGWWPFGTRKEFDDFISRHPLVIRGRGTHLIVALDCEKALVVREIESIADAANISEQAFVLSYPQLTERMIHECDA
jgi:hypothetical protein